MATKLVNGEPVEMSPEEAATFESARTPSTPHAKQAARAAIKVRLVKAERAGFMFLGARIDSDAEMLSRIATLALRAQRAKDDNQAMTVRMVAADDSALSLNRGEMLDLAKAAGDHFIACSEHARTLRQAVGAATTPAEVAAVDINAGWPA